MTLATRVGSVELPNPIMTASGTSGHGAELQAYFPLEELGAALGPDAVPDRHHPFARQAHGV